MVVRKKHNTFYCFSPPVMLATFFIEIGLAFWALWRFRHTPLVRLIVAILLCLAIFQFAEYNICTTRFGISELAWAKLGYVAITALPALGVHALVKIARVRVPWLVSGAYLAMIAFMAYFLFVGHGISQASCGGNYVIFQTNPTATSWYTLYYYGLEVLVLIASAMFARHAHTQRQKQALYGLALAYAVLIVPVVFVTTINPALAHAIPSIMCGFAVFLALILALYVLPKAQHEK